MKWKRVKGRRQSKGHLKVIEQVGYTPDRCPLLLCLCLLCGVNRRTVDVRQFKQHKVTKCTSCANPNRRAWQRKAVELAEAKEKDLGVDPVHENEIFMRSWRDKLKALTFDQRCLYETIVDGREEWDTDEDEEGQPVQVNIWAEAVDVVLRESDPVWALNYYEGWRQDAGEVAAREVFDYCPEVSKYHQKAA